MNVCAQQGSRQRPVEVHLYDMHGICAGASGAAAGLLHPVNPKGKVRSCQQALVPMLTTMLTTFMVLPVHSMPQR